MTHPKNWRNQFELSKVSPAHYSKVVNDMIKEMPKKLEKVLSIFQDSFGSSPFISEYKAHQLKILKRNSQLMTPA